MEINLEMISVSILVIILAGILAKISRMINYDPTKVFKKQGVKGPEPELWSGNFNEMKKLKMSVEEMKFDINCHDIMPRALPFYSKWASQYGETFVFMHGRSEMRLCITNANLVKQVLSNKFTVFRKTEQLPEFLALFGRGLVMIDGDEWARHRKIVGPAFSMDKLKMMTKEMADCTKSMLDTWQSEIVEERVKNSTIEMNHHFEELTADIISHSAFGSSFNEGKQVFMIQKQLENIVIASSFKADIPGYKYLPTKRNRERWGLERKMRNTLMGIFQGRLKSQSSTYGHDLLGLMMESTRDDASTKLNLDEIIDECKTFFFAGYETTSHLLTWTMFLLSTNPEWQERLREEVLNECGREVPNADNLNKFKLVTMVLYEALRLYTPIMSIDRQAMEDTTLGDLTIPKGTIVTLPFALIHHQKSLWGDDVNEFNPMRFKNGLTNAAKSPNGMLGFSVGPRSCVGQNFAMMEAKIVMAMILQRFSFSLSPDYVHRPADIITLKPQYGLPVVLEPLA